MRIRTLLALLCSFVSAASYAGYAQLAPPTGWSAGTGTERATYRAAANEAWAATNTVRTTAALNVGGRAVEVSAAMRMAANAPRFAARALFVNPWVIAGTIAAPYAFEWAQSKGYFVKDGAWQKGEIQICSSACWLYFEEGHETSGPFYANALPLAEKAANGRHQIEPYLTRLGACEDLGSGSFRCQFRNDAQPGGTPFYFGYGFPRKWAPAADPVGRPATPQEFEEDLAPTTMPWQVPNEIPFNVPVERPILNPDPALNPQPQKVPTGDPVAIPNTNPQQYRYPSTTVTPSNTDAEPWRVNLNPEEITTTDPNAPTSPNPATPASATPADDDLCTAHPEIIACQSGSATDTPLPNVPDLYTQKYPDGLAGVWSGKKQQLTGSSLVGLLSSLMPSVSAGTCPVINLNLDVGVVNFGQHDISPPCEVWTFGKWVIIISALLLARSLVYGG
ncbi:hypothetical protein J2X19_002318 [Rhodoferax ferrireducens]|uniref:TspB protein n=1 Tax=Rhodoferax ferrireducens TaxID=192843 RepID=A0ABU2C8J1_9BURK|nr:hypothetical protein [Rhodoferax ferrireducens]MDR7377639.1 hypothetical protein [Rhodoferax ferrireducens]